MSMIAAVRQREFWERSVRTVLAFVLVLWVAALLADVVWLVWKGPASPGYGDLPVITDVAGGEQVTLSTARVRQWELFGEPVVESRKADPADAPETRLRLELLGVFQHPDPKVASAIIAEQGKEGSLFRPGDKVPGNATLEEVYADQVILNRMGQREALRLKSADLGGGVQAQQRSASVARSPRPSPAPAQAEGGPDGTDLAQQRVMIIDRLGLRPSASGGYEIAEGAPEEMLAMVGLRIGDVIVSVNGKSLGDQAADLAALEDFRNSGVATIVVQRGQQRFTVTYPP